MFALARVDAHDPRGRANVPPVQCGSLKVRGMSVLKIQWLKAPAGLWSMRVFTYHLGSFVAFTDMNRKGLALDVTQEVL